LNVLKYAVYSQLLHGRRVLTLASLSAWLLTYTLCGMRSYTFSGKRWSCLPVAWFR